ncbi:MAG: hypothetical protein HN977_02815, partial [Gammaproteobacteria bacterium]|nr:hypothetical protein [Gammaproteobacteria bacterium]
MIKINKTLHFEKYYDMRYIILNQRFLKKLFLIFNLISFLFINSYAQEPLELQYQFGLAKPDTRGGVYVDDEWIWMADHKDGLWRARKCDGSDAGDVTSDDGKLWDIYHSGSYIYGVGDSKKLYIYNDNNGSVVGSKDTKEKAFGVYVKGSYAYVASEDGLEVYNVSTPANPTYVRTVQDDLEFIRVDGTGNFVYATDYKNDKLRIFDISSDASNPSLVGTYDPGMSGDIRGLHVAFPLIYFVNDAGHLYIVNVSNPSSPVAVGDINPSTSDGNSNFPGGGVYVKGNNALYCTASGNDKGYLYWVDVSTPGSPSLINSYYDVAFGFNEPYIEDNYVMVAAHDGFKAYFMGGYQTDELISNTDESNYIGDDVYNSDGTNQTKEQEVYFGQTATFKIKLENESSETQAIGFTSKQVNNGGWTYAYTYYDGSTTTDITSQVVAGTYKTGQLAYGGSVTITLEMTPDINVSVNDIAYDTLMLQSGNNTGSMCTTPELDVVVAKVTKIAVVCDLEVTTGSNSPVCEGSELNLTSTPANGTGTITYSWTGPGGFTSSDQNPTVSTTATLAMAGDYIVTVTDDNECEAKDTISVLINPLPTANAGTDVTINCTTPSKALSASGGGTYSWAPATGLSATNISNPTATPSATTTYTVTVTAANGCTDTDEVKVTVDKNAPTANAGTDVTIDCTTPSKTLSASG